jgi:hypothetical protein
VCWRTAHRTIRCTRTVQLKPATLGFFSGALRYNSPDCLVHQRSNDYPAQRSTATAPWQSDSATVENNARQSQSAESEEHRTVNSTCPVWHRTVRCHKRTSYLTVDWVITLTVGWHGGAPDSVRCAHRQQPSPTTCWWLRAINRGGYGTRATRVVAQNNYIYVVRSTDFGLK